MTVQRIKAHLNQTIAKHQLAHAYLFNGPKGAGQEVIAEWLSMRLFCQNLNNNEPCGTCRNCQRIINGEHPDVIKVHTEQKTIKVDAIRLLKQEFTKSAVEGNHKLLLIERADTMTISAQNSLLKFIEEPIGNTIIVLLTENRNLLLPTIISRTQVIDFELPDLSILESKLSVSSATKGAGRLALRLTGNVDAAEILLQNPAFAKLNHLIWRWFNVLIQGDSAAFAMVQTGFIPLIQEADNQLTNAQLLDGIMFIFRDLLLVDEHQSLVFVDNQTQIVTLSQQLNLELRLQLMELVLKARSNLQLNIGIQNILEALTLEILLVVTAVER